MKIDKTFITQLQNKDRKAQLAFYNYLSPKMYGVCIRFANSSDDANDILQEGFIRVFNHINDYRGEGSFEGWVRRTIVNTAINFYKKEKKRGFKVDLDYIKKDYVVSESAIEKISFNELISLIRELPNGYRTVFNLNVIEGYTHKEIGNMLDISENTSKSQLSRAKSALQKKLADINTKENID
jgi:RNA polymerase sigma-70 factor (ECF subfamily)